MKRSLVERLADEQGLTLLLARLVSLEIAHSIRKGDAVDDD